MLMPDPENELRLLSIEEFLRSTLDMRKNKLYKIILSPLPPLMKRIKATWAAPDGIPNICIVKNAGITETELRDLINTVCLAEGLLEHSLEAQNLALKNLGASKVPNPFGYLSIAKACMMWSCAHEVFHYLRRHALVEKHFGGDNETKHALEYDADLCAIASLYRYLQYFSPKKSKINLKKTALTLIYCSMRININKENSKSFYGSNTHPHTAARIWDISGKLAMLNDSGIPDPNLEHTTTQLHLKILMETTIELELIYSKSAEEKNGPPLSPMFSFAMENQGLKYTQGRHERWDEIQPLINVFATLPREVIDNEKSIAFIGDNFSLPR